jgi:hypothetical protein
MEETPFIREMAPPESLRTVKVLLSPPTPHLFEHDKVRGIVESKVEEAFSRKIISSPLHYHYFFGCYLILEVVVAIPGNRDKARSRGATSVSGR